MALGLAVALVGVAAFVLLSGDEAGAEVLLEAKAAPGPDPFTVPIESAAPPPQTGAPAQPSTPAQPISNPPAVSVNVGGTSVGLYGGTNENVCDKQKLISFLQGEPAKAAAFSSVLGIPQDQISSYVSALTPAVLQVDTRVTNHGFKGGNATPRQSVLQTGTAVLVDPQGTPRVRCKCGNPLVPPEVSQAQPTYTGTRWPEFRPEAVAAPPGTDLSPSRENSPAAEVPQEQVTHGPDLVQNGGFESGMDPWGRQIIVDASFGPSSESAKEGSSALRIENRSPFQPNKYLVIFQRMNVETGSNYCLFFWARTVSGQPGILSFTLDRAWEDKIGLPPGTKDWTLYTRTFVAESPPVDLRMISENTGTVYVDAIQLRKGKCKVNGEVPVGNGI